MRMAIEKYTEMKIAVINNAQDTVKETFSKEADIRKLISKKTFKGEYIRLIDMSIQKLIDNGSISDILELSNMFGRRINGHR